MRKFNVTVNGIAYEVEVEELNGGAAAPVAPIQTVAAPAPATAPAPAPAAAPAAPKASAPKAANAVKVEAPMQGTILKVAVADGASVKAGDLICVLEAMKMENDIVAPQDGTVSSLSISQNATINTGDTICFINPVA